MTTAAKKTSALVELEPNKIQKNPENPRLIFRESDMQALLQSIKEVGIQVPLSVYPEGSKYTLLDGERRWRCSRKLNLRVVPAIVLPKPSPLENLLMMFNIHNVRKDWDLMPMALKIGKVRDLLKQDGKPTNATRLAAVTALSLGQVRRALELLDLPDEYQKRLLKEAEKPSNEQLISPDTYLETAKSWRALERSIPEISKSVKKREYVESMVDKYANRVIDNVVDYRLVSKIARGSDRPGAVKAIVRLVRQADYSVRDAYANTVQGAVESKEILTRAQALLKRLGKLDDGGTLSDDTLNTLTALAKKIRELVATVR